MELIAAVTKDWGLGKDNELLVHISPDLKRFKELTTGHTVIMGRKTLQSMPKGKPLPNRRNLILSTSLKEVEGAEVFHTVEDLLLAAPEDSFVIGGGAVYEQLLPYCSVAHLTKVDTILPADTYFPNLDEDDGWVIESEEKQPDYEGLSYSFVTYRYE